MRNRNIWIGVAVGSAVGVGYALLRKRDHHFNPKTVTKKLSDHREELLDAGKDLIERVGRIYEEGRKVVEDAAELYTHGRRLVGY